MRKRTLVLTALAVAAVFLVSVYALRFVSQRSRLWFVYSTIRHFPASRIEAAAAGLGTQWKQLSPAEYRGLIQPQTKQDNKLLYDLWGHEYLLSIRKGELQYEFILRSAGADGRLFTVDDYLIDRGHYYGSAKLANYAYLTNATPPP